MVENQGEIPVLKPGVELALPGNKQPEIDEATRKLYNDSLPKTVQIVTDTGVGSGVIMDKDGNIGSAAHVVLGSREQFAVTSDGTKYKLQISKLDDINDTVVLHAIGFKPDKAAIAEMGSSKDLKAFQPLFPMGHPGGIRPAYISPGIYNSPLTNGELIKGLHEMTEEQLQDMVKSAITDKEMDNMQAALKRPLLAADVHIRQGDSGGPVFDGRGRVVGLNDMISSYEKGFFVPVEKLTDLYNSKQSDFNFTYHRLAEPWAQDYKNTWQQKPLTAFGQTATAAAAGYGAYRIASAYLPRGAGVAAALYEGFSLSDDVRSLLSSTDSRDTLKYSLASATDLVGLAGSVAFFTSRYRVGGAIGLGVGIAGRLAADFIPSRLVLTDLERKSNPLIPPFNQNIEKTLGL